MAFAARTNIRATTMAQLREDIDGCADTLSDQVAKGIELLHLRC